MDSKDALPDTTEYSITFRGLKWFFTLRDPSSPEDLEFRRRSGKVKVKNGKLESSDEALNAPLWLFETIKTRVEYSNGTNERLEVSDDLYKKIPSRTKLAIITRHLQDLEGEEAEVQKN